MKRLGFTLSCQRYFSISNRDGAKVTRTKVSTSDPFDQFGPVLSANVFKAKIKESKSSSTKGNSLSNQSKIQSTSMESTKIHPNEIVEKVKKIVVPDLLNANRSVIATPDSVDNSDIMKIPFTYNKECPSVTRILSATMSEESKAVLARWEKEKIALLGEDGFKKYKADMFARGKTLHSILEDFLESRRLPRTNEVEDDISKRHILSLSQMIHGVDRPLAIESSVVHPDLGYSGIMDCVAVINNTLTLIDWKTSERVKNSKKALYDNPLQLAAYIGAINQDPAYECLGNITQGAVVVVYNTGYPAMIHAFNETQLAKYWSLWCERLDMYKSLNL